MPAVDWFRDIRGDEVLLEEPTQPSRTGKRDVPHLFVVREANPDWDEDPAYRYYQPYEVIFTDKPTWAVGLFGGRIPIPEAS